MTEVLLTVAEVANRLKVNQQTVRNWLIRGELCEVRVGPRRVRIRESDLEAFLAGNRESPPQPEEAPGKVSIKRPAMSGTGSLSIEELAALDGCAELMFDWAARLNESSRLGRDLAEVAGRAKAMTRRLLDTQSWEADASA
jgi:excisionase family DNA binding protein